MKISEVFERLDAATMANILASSIREVIFGGVLPIPVVDFYLRAVSNEVIRKIEQLVSIKEIVVVGMTEDPAMLGHFFQRVGSEELKFLVNSGTYFGFILGLFQMMQWIIYPVNWTLPIGGAVVGFVTNWIALKMVFEPVEPVSVGPFMLQGMFLKRQKEVSAEFSQYLANNVLTSREIWKTVLEGAHAKEFEAIISRNVPFLTSSMVQSIMQSLKHQLLVDDMGDGLYRETVTGSVEVDKVGGRDTHEGTVETEEECTSRKHPLHSYIDHTLDLEDTLLTRMMLLTPHQFERVLHPIFEEVRYPSISN